jgi:hypothetical protein
MGLQVRPEQLAEQICQPLQRREIRRRLPFAQVVDEHVAHRAAADPVAVDQLLAAGLPAAGEHLDRGGCVDAEVAASTQELVEQRASGVSVGRGTRAFGTGGEELDAVADPHLINQAALGGHDDRDLGQCPLLALQPDPALLAQRGQRGEGGRIASAGHLRGEIVSNRRELQHPVQAGPDHIGAHQHQQPRAQMRQRLVPGGADQVAPVGLVFGAAGHPSLLPAITGLGSQPVHHG